VRREGRREGKNSKKRSPCGLEKKRWPPLLELVREKKKKEGIKERREKRERRAATLVIHEGRKKASNIPLGKEEKGKKREREGSAFCNRCR